MLVFLKVCFVLFFASITIPNRRRSTRVRRFVEVANKCNKKFLISCCKWILRFAEAANKCNKTFLIYGLFVSIQRLRFQKIVNVGIITRFDIILQYTEGLPLPDICIAFRACHARFWDEVSACSVWVSWWYVSDLFCCLRLFECVCVNDR